MDSRLNLYYTSFLWPVYVNRYGLLSVVVLTNQKAVTHHMTVVCDMIGYCSLNDLVDTIDLAKIALAHAYRECNKYIITVRSVSERLKRNEL